MLLRKFELTALTFLLVHPALASNNFCRDNWKKYNESRFAQKDERKVAFDRRSAACCMRSLMEPRHDIECEGNGDEKRVPFFAAQFSKTLEHDPATGLLTDNGQENYKLLVRAMRNGKQDAFNAIQRAPGASTLVNPQGGLTFGLEGCDSSLFELPAFPCISSPEAAAILIEDYLMALCRDVKFSDYGTGLGSDATTVGTKSLTKNAAAVLQDLGPAYTGPRNVKGVVDASVLFRGNSYGNLIGPYLSQFFLFPVTAVFNAGNGTQNLNRTPFIIDNQQKAIASTREFGVSLSNFVAIENGLVPQPYQASDYDPVNQRYMITGRDIASYVHFDSPCEAGFNTVTILLANHFPFSPNSPYSNGSIKNEGPYVTFGFFDIYALLGTSMWEAGKAAWAQKWRAYRALRPEAFAGLVNYVKMTGNNPFKLDNSLFVPHAGIDVLALIQAKNTVQGASTYLLSQVYPEGSPTHPSYPAAHAVIAGACVTVIKAIFDDTVKISSILQPVKVNPNNPTQLVNLSVAEGANDLTLAGELDKMAANVCNGRDFAGIHYRCDGDEGMLLGEQVAIRVLQDRCCTITEQTFNGYELTTIQGQRIHITAHCVEIIG